MKFKTIPFIITLFFTTNLLAAVNGHYSLDNITVNLDNGDKAVISLQTKLSLDTIAGKPKVECVGKWSFQYAEIDSRVYRANDLPEKVVKELAIRDVDIRYQTGMTGTLNIAYVDCDHGVFKRSGDNQYSYTTAASSNWDKTFLQQDSNYYLYYVNEDSAKRHMQYLKKQKSLPQGVCYGYNNMDCPEVINAKLNVHALRQYIAKQKKKENSLTEEFEDMLDATEKSSLNTDDLFAELDSLERSEQKSRSSSVQESKLKPLKQQRDNNLKKCEKGAPESPPEEFKCYKEIVDYVSSCPDVKDRKKGASYYCFDQPVYESDSVFSSRCSQERQLWEDRKHNYNSDLQKWQNQREQCRKDAKQDYQAAIRQLEREEQMIDDMVGELNF